MSGIYIHIPFCKKACHYCDFHFSTSQTLRKKVVHSIIKELELQKNFLEGDIIETIYFGGGTPSLIPANELQLILESLFKNYSILDGAEVTLEANPDDLDIDKLRFLWAAGINRLSIGNQSFNESFLKFLNRSHTSKQSLKVVEEARNTGFKNINLDLIYAIPFEGHQVWKADVAQIIKLCPEHISAYCLTIEEKTVFGNWIKKGKFISANEDFAIYQFQYLMDELENAGYEQYEVSNFSLPGLHSKHNSNYWKQKKYVGIGPGAHSYNGYFRQHNIANNAAYVKAIEKNEIPFVVDELTVINQANEYILTTIRTKWGLNLKKLACNYKMDITIQKAYLQNLINEGYANMVGDSVVLTKKGLFLADKIASDLFFEE